MIEIRILTHPPQDPDMYLIEGRVGNDAFGYRGASLEHGLEQIGDCITHILCSDTIKP